MNGDVFIRTPKGQLMQLVGERMTFKEARAFAIAVAIANKTPMRVYWKGREDLKEVTQARPRFEGVEE